MPARHPELATTGQESVTELGSTGIGSRASWIASFASALLLLVGLAGFALHNLGNRYLWNDESSTFLNALGWPAPGQSSGSLAAMWHGTTNYFLDPGLFPLVLRFWIPLTGSHIGGLRLLPFLLFLCYLIAIILLARLTRTPWYAACGVAGLMLLENITPYYAVELRPYSGGQAASVVLPLLAILLLLNRRIWMLVGFLIGFVFFASMQYNSVPITIGCVTMLAVALVAHWVRVGRRLDHESVILLIAVVVAFAWLPILYFASRSGVEHDPQAAVMYMESNIMRHEPLSKIVHDLVGNFFSFTAMPRTVFLIAVPITWWRTRTSPFRPNIARPKWIANVLWIYVLLSTCVGAALAALGLLPWILGTRWSITDIGLVAVSIIGLLAMLLDSRWGARKSFAALLLCASLAACVLGAARMWSYERVGNINYLRALAPTLFAQGHGAIQVDAWLFNDVRYWLEYSPDMSDYRQAWLKSSRSQTTAYLAAGAPQITEFLASHNQALLLRSKRALEDSGVQLPDSIAIVEVPAESLGNVSPEDAPIVLLKKRA